MHHFTQVLLSLGLISLLSIPAVAQRGAAGLMSGSFKPYAGEAIDAFDLREKETIGSTFWNDVWLAGAVKLSDGRTVQGYPLRYDIANECVDLQTLGTVKTIPAKVIEEFTLRDGNGSHRFIDAGSYFGLVTQGSNGFYEVLVEGKMSLLVQTNLDVQKGNYVTALDAGDATDRIVKKEVFYLMDGKGLVILPTNKKKRLSVLKEYLPSVESRLKTENWKVKKTADLVKLVNYMNQRSGE